MAGMMWSSLARTQYRGIAHMRLRAALNSLRKSRGGFELGASVIIGIVFVLIGLAIAIGLAFGTVAMIRSNHPEFVASLTWGVFAVWQWAPIAAATLGETVDLSNLVRFPLSFGSYYLIYIIYGICDRLTLFGGTCLAGIAAGVAFARYTGQVASSGAVLWTVIVLSGFAMFNVLVTRTLFAWVERWLAQRRTREIVGFAVLLLSLGVQLIPSTLSHVDSVPFSKRAAVLQRVGKVQRYLPPGAAGHSIASAVRGDASQAVVSFGVMCGYGIAVGALLGIRLRAQLAGENLDQAPVPSGTTSSRERSRAAEPVTDRHAWPVLAVFMKELRTMMRSGSMLYNTLAPLLFVLIMGRDRSPVTGGRGFEYALPLAAAYSLLGLVTLIYNVMGTEGFGVQTYFSSPTPLSRVFLGKNLFHLALFALEMLVIWAIIIHRYGTPSSRVLLATILWLLYAMPLNLALGNLFSVRLPYKRHLEKMSGQGSAGNSLMAMLSQATIVASGAAVFYVGARTGIEYLPIAVFAMLAMFGLGAYVLVLQQIDRYALNRRESIIAAVTKE